jgi:hypothetical protein
MTDPLLPSPPSLLKQAIKAVPAVKWALGVGGIIALIAIVSSFGIGFKVAILGSVVMFVLMAMLVVFGSLAGQKSSSFHMPALVFTWFSLILVMATASALFIAVFWGNPEEIRMRLGIQSAPAQTTDLGTSRATVPATVPAAVPATTTTEKVSAKTSEPSTSPTAAKETPAQDVPSNRLPTAEEYEMQQHEAPVHGHEVQGDSDAEQSIGYMYCGLQGCNNKPPNQRDIDEARRLWAVAVAQWTLAYNTTNDPTYSDRLREKIRPESGVTCNDQSCESNFTHENREFGIHIPVNQFDPQ